VLSLRRGNWHHGAGNGSGLSGKWIALDNEGRSLWVQAENPGPGAKFANARTIANPSGVVVKKESVPVVEDSEGSGEPEERVAVPRRGRGRPKKDEVSDASA